MPGAVDVTPLASELRVVLGRLLRRLRAEHRVPLTQAAVLGRLDREGAQSIGDLAAAEQVRPQSMSQTLGELEAEGLVRRQPDARDGRRILVELTHQGRLELVEDRAVREGWLASTLTEHFSEAELRVLERAVALLQRLSEM
ncbi:MAG TPA: MarR family transcriptional regulator [Solirubrobacteraceae bacterium]|nr:MarR family transcriptional regulator [Solirubrobacteraceae bacterium]